MAQGENEKFDTKVNGESKNQSTIVAVVKFAEAGNNENDLREIEEAMAEDNSLSNLPTEEISPSSSISNDSSLVDEKTVMEDAVVAKNLDGEQRRESTVTFSAVVNHCHCNDDHYRYHIHVCICNCNMISTLW